MTTLQQALLKIQPQAAQVQAQSLGVIHYSTPQWVEAPDFTFSPRLKKVFLYIEEDWNVSAHGGAVMMADRRLRLSELPLGDFSKATRQCAFGTCYCEELDLDSSNCSSGWFEESRRLVGVVLAPKGARAAEIWGLVPYQIIHWYDRRKSPKDLHQWVEAMPTN